MQRLHPTGPHPESAERLQVLLASLERWNECGPATEDDVARCHDRAYIERIREISSPTWLDPDTVGSATSYDGAMLSAGAAIEAARQEGFALARPPGHHALSARAMGFCLFGSVAVAARYAQAELGVERVAIVDWDVHHGNGTQEIFWDDPSVFFVSLHQWPFYPGSGGPDEQNETTLNVPLPAGSGDDDYAAAFSEKVEPAVAAFDPELVLVSAGFDAHEQDPLAMMEVTENGFRELARRSAALAPRVAAVLEGGYNLETLPRLVHAALEGFSADRLRPVGTGCPRAKRPQGKDAGSVRIGHARLRTPPCAALQPPERAYPPGVHCSLGGCGTNTASRPRNWRASTRAGSRPWTGSTCVSSPARSTGFSARTAPGSRRPCTC